MRTRYLALILAPLAGCTDTLGIGGNCQAEMASVRQQFGSPDDTESVGESQLWFYDARPGRGRFTYEFDWASGTCLVSGPNPYTRAPTQPIRPL